MIPRVAIIGAGRIGTIRRDVIHNTGNAVVRVIADMNLSRAEEGAQCVEAEASCDWKEVVTRKDIDIVVVSTYPKSHPEIVIAALRAGKHVLCEKPLGRTAEEARQMIDVAIETGLVLKPGLNYRYMAHVRKAKEILDSGILGPIYFMRSRFGNGGGPPGFEKVWRSIKDLTGPGLFLEQGIHIFDLFRYFIGEPDTVSAEVRRYFWNFDDGAPDNGFCTLTTAAGQLANFHISWTQWINIFEVELFGRDGYLRLEGREKYYGPQRLILGMRKDDHSRPEEEFFEFGPIDHSWDLEWRHFLDVVKTGRCNITDMLDGLRAQQMVEAAYRSAEEGQKINLPIFRREYEYPCNWQ